MLRQKKIDKNTSDVTIFKIVTLLEVKMKRFFSSFSAIFAAAFLVVFGFVSIAYASVAKDNKKKDKTRIFHPHEQVVVTATMTQKAVKECAASVTIIDRNEIDSIPSSSALNLLSFSPGIQISQTGDFGRADINIRGLGERGRKIALLIDGRPEKMGLFGCLVTHTFPLDNVERIEIVRGPASVLYGSEALGGVVNIMTHMPSLGFETEASASYGSYNTHQYTLKHGGVVKRLSYFFTMDRRTSNGHRENTGYAGSDLTGKIRYALTDNLSLSLQGKYFDGKKHEAGPVDYPLAAFWNDYKRGALDLTLKKEGQKDDWMFKLYRNFGHHLFSDSWHSRDFVTGGLFHYTTRSSRGNELTLGSDFRFLAGRSYAWPKGRWDKNEAAVFFREQLVLKKKWILSGGARLQKDSLYGMEFCPQMGVVLRAGPKTALRAFISKGFRSPQLNELYMFPAANPGLKPERVWNYELGLEQTIGGNAAFAASVFRMKGSNLVEMKWSASPPPMFRFQNAGQYTFTGFELSIHMDLFRTLFLQTSYSYLNTGSHTRGRPGHKFAGLLRLHKGRIFASLNSQYVTNYHAGDFSMLPLPSYFLMNSRLSIELSKKLDIFVDLYNLFNEDYLIYVELPGTASGAYPMPGRHVNIGLRWEQ